MSKLTDWISKAWHTRRVKVGTIIAAAVIVLGFTADVTGILDYFGITPGKPGGQPIVPASPVPVATAQTPGPTPYPISALHEIKREDFSKASGWDSYSTSNGTTGFENGQYFIQLSDQVLFLSLWEDAGLLDNSILQVDVLSQPEVDDHQQGIGYGWRRDWEGSTYAFVIDGFGNCAFKEAIDGWHTRETGRAVDFDKERSYHTLKVYIRYNEAIGFVDDQFCARYIMPDYKPGYVGVVAAPGTGSKSGKYYFDEYRIFQIP